MRRLTPFAAALLVGAIAATAAPAAPVTSIRLPPAPGRAELAAIPGTPGAFVAWLDRTNIEDSCSPCVRSPFTTLDGGRTWRPATTWPTSRRVQDVTSDPRRAGRLWALARLPDDLATGPGELLRSDDGGLTWTSAGLTPEGATEIVATTEHLVVAHDGGLSTSVDGTRFTSRATFTASGLAVGTDGRRVYAVQVDLRDAPFPPGAFQVVTRLATSADAGRTWVDGSRIGGDPLFGGPAAIAVDPRDPRRLLESAGGILGRSHDAGRTVQHVAGSYRDDTTRRRGVGILADGTAIASRPSALLVGPADGTLRRVRRPLDDPGSIAAWGDVALVGLANGLLAREGGRLEERAGPPLGAPAVVVDVAALPDGAAIATADGLLVRLAGQRPRPATGVPAHRAIEAVEAAGSRAFAVTRGGAVYRSTDGGETWSPTAPLGIAAGEHATLALGGGGATVYVTSGRSVRVSDDGGATWRRSSALPARAVAFTVAASPVDARVAWVGTAGGALVRTVDGGRSWTRLIAGRRAPRLVVPFPDARQPQSAAVLVDRRMVRVAGRDVTAATRLPVGSWTSIVRAGRDLVGLRVVDDFVGNTRVERSRDDGTSWQLVREVRGATGLLAVGADGTSWAMAGDGGPRAHRLLTWSQG